MPEASSILRRVALGDRTAVDDCIKQYGGLIWSIGKRYLRDVTEVEDVTQEVFVELWQKAGRFDPSQGSEASFVALIARRRMTDRLRRAGRAKSAPQTHHLDEVDEIGVSEGDSLVWDEETRRTASCLQKLDAVRRSVLIMHLRDGESHRRIADALKLPLGTIKSHARRGLLQVQRCVGLHDGVEASSSLARGDLR